MLLLLATLAVIFFDLTSASQCSVGLKLYSVESGKVVCASLSHFTCIEACEWNTTCALTSHYEAFRGRRTYVAGMILTDSTFLLQCCASLGSVVEMNEGQEPTCTWSQLIDTVPDKGSIRFDPPLGTNEYVRDMIMERKGVSGAVLRAQVCKFVKQRDNCDRGPMSEEELRQYSILLLRLTRTKDLLKRGGSFSTSRIHSLVMKPIVTDAKKVAERHSEDSLKDETPVQHRTSHNRLNSFHSLIKHTVPTAANRFSSAFRRGNIANRRIPHSKSTTAVVDTDAVVSSNADDDGGGEGGGGRFPVVDDDTARRVRKDQPAGIVMSGSVGRTARHPHGRRNLAEAVTSSSKSWPLLLPNKSAMETDESLDARRALLQSPPAKGVAYASSKIAGEPYSVQISAREALASWPGGATPKLRSRVNADQTHFLDPSSPVKAWDEPPHPGSALAEVRGNRKKGVENERGRKLHDGQTSTSYGGSFAAGPTPADTAAIEDPAEAFEWKLPYSPRIGGNGDGRLSVAPQLHQTTQLGRAPPFKIIPISRPFARHLPNTTYSSNHAKPALTPHRSIVANGDIDVGREHLAHRKHLLPPAHIDGNELGSPDELAAMAGLLRCCEHQSPSCRQLCSRDVNKEQIKHAIISHQCPPLSMTSVIQCYARYFNITPVAECCAAQAHAGLPTLHTTGALLPIGGGTPNGPTRLPQQCTALCAPNFKLSISHLACIDHISSIVDCYRELISRR